MDFSQRWDWEKSPKIPDSVKLLIWTLLEYLDDEGICNPSEWAIRNRWGWSKRKIERIVCQAENAGIINVYRVKGEKNQYSFPFITSPNGLPSELTPVTLVSPIYNNKSKLVSNNRYLYTGDKIDTGVKFDGSCERCQVQIEMGISNPDHAYCEKFYQV